MKPSWGDRADNGTEEDADDGNRDVIVDVVVGWRPYDRVRIVI
jgi:hypothetical protein